MIVKLTQNEITKIPRDRAEYVDFEGNTISATSKQYFWLPLKRLRDTKQVIWVEDGADIGTLVVEAHTFIDSDGITQDIDMSEAVKQAKDNYIKTMTVTTLSGKVFDAHMEARMNMLTAKLEALENGLPDTTETTWRLATDDGNSSSTITLLELKEASAKAIRKFASLKGI